MAGKSTMLGGALLLALCLLASADGHAAAPAAVEPAPVEAKAGADAAEAARLDAEIVSARGALTSRPADAAALSHLGTLLLRRGSYDEALQQFSRALAVNPRSSEARIGTGAVLARTGELEKAEQVLQEAALHSPDPVRAHYELGLIHQQRGNFDRAAAEFKEGIRKSQQGRR